MCLVWGFGLSSPTAGFYAFIRWAGLTTKIEAVGSFETFVCIYKSTRRQVPEDGRDQLKCDGTLAETRFRLSAKRTSPFKSAGASFQSTTGSRVVRISSYYWQ